MRRAGMIASFEFEFDTYAVKQAASEAKAQQPHPDESEKIPEDRGEVRGRQAGPHARAPVPLAVETDGEVGGHVREIAHRPVRVPAFVRGLAAPVRLDVLPDVTVSVGEAARLAIVGGHVPVRHIALDDALAAVDPGKADVDHVRVRHVESDAEAHQGEGRDEQHRGGPDRPR
jgi:hypothetical protein